MIFIGSIIPKYNKPLKKIVILKEFTASRVWCEPILEFGMKRALEVVGGN